MAELHLYIATIGDSNRFEPELAPGSRYEMTDFSHIFFLVLPAAHKSFVSDFQSHRVLADNGMFVTWTPFGTIHGYDTLQLLKESLAHQPELQNGVRWSEGIEDVYHVNFEYNRMTAKEDKVADVAQRNPGYNFVGAANVVMSTIGDYEELINLLSQPHVENPDSKNTVFKLGLTLGAPLLGLVGPSHKVLAWTRHLLDRLNVLSSAATVLACLNKLQKTESLIQGIEDPNAKAFVLREGMVGDVWRLVLKQMTSAGPLRLKPRGW